MISKEAESETTAHRDLPARNSADYAMNTEARLERAPKSETVRPCW